MPESPAKPFSGIFVSYRRDDCAGHAGRLSDRLVGHFGKDQIFMDIDNIQPGEDFVQVIENAVGSCEILIAIIGRHWLSGAGESSQWLDNPNDFVRLEIATALSRDIRVIPVLVQRASMPKPQDLPDDLAKFTRRNAVELTDLRWQSDVDQLISVMEGILTGHDETERRTAQEQEEQKRRKADEKRRAEEVESERRQAGERQKREAEQEAERRRLAERNLRNGKGKRTTRFVILALVLVVILGGILGVGVIAVVWLQTTREGEQHSANQNATPTGAQQPDQTTSASPPKAAGQPSTGSEQTEAEVAEARAAQAKAEQESREKKDVWLVVIIRNKMSTTIPYQILDKGSWVTFTLPPGMQIVHTPKNEEVINIKYDYKFEPGSQVQEYTLQGTAVVGHEPIVSEKATGKVYHFDLNAAGDIGLYPEQ